MSWDSRNISALFSLILEQLGSKPKFSSRLFFAGRRLLNGTGSTTCSTSTTSGSARRWTTASSWPAPTARSAPSDTRDTIQLNVNRIFHNVCLTTARPPFKSKLRFNWIDPFRTSRPPSATSRFAGSGTRTRSDQNHSTLWSNLTSTWIGVGTKEWLIFARYCNQYHRRTVMC